MNEKTKTIAFACVGGLMLALAGVTYFVTKPTISAGFERLGQPFFESFTDSSAAKSLEVYAIDPDSAERKRFVVKEDGGVWQIPSHHDYPAEAADRLATTASSLIGIEREALKGKHKSEHERFGVLDPNDPDVTDPEATGKRVTLKDDSGDVLVDLIIGKRVEDEDLQPEQMVVGQNVTTDRYYVRHPEENQTYVVSLDLDLSTKFSDWIRPDLLQVENSEIEMLHINNYEIATSGGRLAQQQGDQLWLRREDGVGNWVLDGVNAEVETFEESKATTAVSTLDELKIVGVRPKMEYQGQSLITPDLKINEIPELMKDPAQFNRRLQELQVQLIEYGFNLLPTEVEGQLQLVSNFGELEVGTGAGVLYTMQFGKSLDGDEGEIEIGSPKDEKAADEDSGEEKTEDGAAAEGANESKEEDIKNRYVMIRVSLDEKLLGEKPVKPEPPVEPVKPEGYVPASDEAADSTGDAADDDAAPAPEGSETDDDGAKKDEPSEENAKEERDPKFVQYDQMLKEFDSKKTQYELELTRFADETKSFEEQFKKGEQRVKELNERFGSWFYVISSENLKSLQLKRTDLVSVKEKAEGDAPVAPGVGLPDRPNLNFNMGDPAEAPATDNVPAEKPAEEPAEATEGKGTATPEEPDTPEQPDAPEVKSPESLEQTEIEKASDAAKEPANENSGSGEDVENETQTDSKEDSKSDSKEESKKKMPTGETGQHE